MDPGLHRRQADRAAFRSRRQERHRHRGHAGDARPRHQRLRRVPPARRDRTQDNSPHRQALSPQEHGHLDDRAQPPPDRARRIVCRADHRDARSAAARAVLSLDQSGFGRDRVADRSRRLHPRARQRGRPVATRELRKVDRRRRGLQALPGIPVGKLLERARHGRSGCAPDHLSGAGRLSARRHHRPFDPGNLPARRAQCARLLRHRAVHGARHRAGGHRGRDAPAQDPVGDAQARGDQSAVRHRAGKRRARPVHVRRLRAGSPCPTGSTARCTRSRPTS